MNEQCVDIVIYGGGLVGLASALALTTLGLSVFLYEQPVATPLQDRRSLALSLTTKNFFSALGAWETLTEKITPIKHIHVSEKGCLGKVYLDAVREGKDALGYVIGFEVLEQELRNLLSNKKGLTILPVSKDQCCVIEDDRVVLCDGNQKIKPSLLLICDGQHSALRKQLGIDANTYSYEQEAWVTFVTTSQWHQHTAYERFIKGKGPLALLPYQKGSALIWTMKKEESDDWKKRDKKEHLDYLQEIFGFYLGKLLTIEDYSIFPLNKVVAEHSVKHNALLLGNAYAYLHPVAGQNFNLALRDIAALVDVIQEGIEEGAPLLQISQLLRAYELARDKDRKAAISFTHYLIQYFQSQKPLSSPLRSLSLMMTEHIPLLKKEIVRLASGKKYADASLLLGVPIDKHSFEAW